MGSASALFLIPLIRSIQWLIEHSPSFVSQKSISWVAGFLWVIFPFSRKAVKDNLKQAGKGSSRRVFVNFARTFSHFLSCSQRARRPPLLIEQEDLFHKTYQQGQGVILLTAHLGHWELGAYQLSDWGLKTTAVYQPYRNLRVNGFIQGHRAPEINWVAVSRGASRAVLQALKNKEIVILMGDTPFGEEGEWVEFLGRKLCMSRGPAVLSVRAGTPLLPVFIVYEKGRYKALIEDPLWPQGSGEEAVKLQQERFRQILEKMVRQYPEQWYVFKPFWTRTD